jgi:hypothetical protein
MHHQLGPTVGAELEDGDGLVDAAEVRTKYLSE